MRVVPGLVLLLSACAAHADPADPVQTDDGVALVIESTAAGGSELAAACRAAGPSLTNLLLEKAPNAAPHVDAICARISESCLDRGQLADAQCMADATSLADARRCAPEWALPWMGVPGCDAYLLDVLCVLDELDSPANQAEEAMYQVYDAWFTVPLQDLPEGTLNEACETAVDALMRDPLGAQCAAGRASRALTD